MITHTIIKKINIVLSRNQKKYLRTHTHNPNNQCDHHYYAHHSKNFGEVDTKIVVIGFFSFLFLRTHVFQVLWNRWKKRRLRELCFLEQQESSGLGRFVGLNFFDNCRIVEEFLSVRWTRNQNDDDDCHCVKH